MAAGDHVGGEQVQEIVVNVVVRAAGALPVLNVSPRDPIRGGEGGLRQSGQIADSADGQIVVDQPHVGKLRLVKRAKRSHICVVIEAAGGGQADAELCCSHGWCSLAL